MTIQKNIIRSIITTFSFLLIFQATGQILDKKIIIDAEIIDVNCFGSNNGSIDLKISGGVSPYKVIWDNGSSKNHLTDLYGGLYTVTIADAENTTIKKTFRLKSPPPLSIMISITDISEEGSNDGKIITTIKGGEQPYTFNWSNDKHSRNLENLTPGHYQLTVIDNNGCNLSIGGELEIKDQNIYVNANQVNID